MKTALVSLLILSSLSAQADIIDKIKNYLGIKEPAPKIQIPALPSGKTNPKDFGGNKRTKNQVTYSEKKTNSYNYSYLKELYLVINQKVPSNDFLSKWLNVLGQGGSREGVYRSLVLDRNYLALENYNGTITENTGLFTINYMQRFLGRTLAKKKVMSTNVYTISRSLIEKSLEILDVLLMRPTDDVYDWYAVLSSELATDYPDVWTNSVRGNKSAEYHKAWAKGVPDDYIKSEVIIKLSKVLRFLESQ